MSQNKTILNYLKDGNNITSMQAFSMFGVTRLASRIWDLKQAGHEFTITRINKENTHYNIYKLNK